MSESPKSEAPDTAEQGADASGVIPVEVEAPDPAPASDPVAELQAKLAVAEKEKKDN